MPWTFAHPAAVLPLKRFCPAPLAFSALVVGSLTPDLGYYLHRFDVAQFAHGLAGSFAVCLPAGLGLLGVLHPLRAPLCFLLPQPHRAALTSLPPAPPRRRREAMFWMSVSVLLGAWTHIGWDAFTHRSGWVVSRVTAFQEPLFRLGGAEFPAYYMLQQLSTLGGTAMLTVAYIRWLRRRPAPPPGAGPAEGDRWRRVLLFALAAVSALVAAALAAGLAGRFDGFLAVRVFVFRAGLYFTAVFIPLWIASSIVGYGWHRRRVAEP